MTVSSIDRVMRLLLLSLVAVLPGLCAQGARTCGTVRDSVLFIAGGTRAIPARAFVDRNDFRQICFESPVVLREIGEYAFLGCGSLSDLELPATVEKLGEGAFRECQRLRRAAVGGRVTVLPRYIFAWCSALEDVALPEGLRDIGSHSFIYCSNLGKISIPAGVSHIGSNAFTMCELLEEVDLPASITELESYAFAGCTSLVNAVLPANRQLLGELIFSGCRALREIHEMSPVPPEFDCASTLFEPEEDYMYARCRLVVPASAQTLYSRAAGWSLFFRHAK